MEFVKQKSIYEFQKKMNQYSGAEFLKLIKITKNWKVIGYFKDQKALEEAVEDSCTQGDQRKIWLIRNKKTIYKDDKKKREKEKTEDDRTVEVPKGTQKQPTTTEPESKQKIATPVTPPDRIYLGLSNWATNKDRFSNKEQNEDEIVDLIKSWRLQEKEETEGSTSDLSNNNFERENAGPLKRDNVPTQEVVEIIKEYRTNEKIKYDQYKTSTNDKDIKTKLQEIKNIFDQTSNEMEWEKINHQAASEIIKEVNLVGLEDLRVWALEKNNFFRIGEKIISLAEQNEIMNEYTTLNDNFTKRLKDENRNTKENVVGEKRIAQDSPSKLIHTPGEFTPDEIAEDKEKHAAWVEWMKQKRAQELEISPSEQHKEVKKKDKENGNKRKGKKKKSKGDYEYINRSHVIVTLKNFF
ncbi:hypothetical protein RhiirA4_427666 [Rhizophagus irregularis]|uniref:Uncharacterized protein n=1 Tax=Rhizophagus irregularis TaxID=588596 RepID=A0A2I1H9U0_9GLOM|nr:hypothetical protein RhiirA4_427666 [Rhizophagus irregularis]